MKGSWDSLTQGLRLVLFGPPGAGKGTQAQLLVDRLKIPHISSGDLFRHHLQNGTPLGLKAADYMNSGALVPDELTIDIALGKVMSLNTEEGFILDGFPHKNTGYCLLFNYKGNLIQKRQDFLHLGCQPLPDMILQNIKWRVDKRLFIQVECMKSGLNRFFWWTILNRLIWNLLFIRWLHAGTGLSFFETAAWLLLCGITTWFLCSFTLRLFRTSWGWDPQKCGY